MIVKSVLEPAGPKRKTAVSQQAMIGQADPDSARQPVQENADGHPGPGKKGRHKSKKCESVQGPDPDQGDPGQPCRRRLRRGRCRHDQPLFVNIAEDGFVVVGGPKRRAVAGCRGLIARFCPELRYFDGGPRLSARGELACNRHKCVRSSPRWKARVQGLNIQKRCD